MNIDDFSPKITAEIDRLARWFDREMGDKHSIVSYIYEAYIGSSWSVCWIHHGLNTRYAGSWTGLKETMRVEIRRQRILFKRF